MKKALTTLTIIWLSGIALFLVQGCSGEIEYQTAPGNTYVTDTGQQVEIGHFTYEDHKYIHFTAQGGTNSQGVVHDPDCPCQTSDIKHPE